MIINMAGGGVALNFKVLGYASKEALLAATPAENTFGVITDAKITSWIISPSEPAELTEGMVWIATAANSPAGFNALKKNCIQINPVSAKQYISGVLVEKTAYLYSNASWVQVGYPTVYLYKNGDRNFEVTGDYHRDSPTGTLVPDGTAEDGTKYLNFFSRPDGDGLYKRYIHYTGKKIDFTPFRYLIQTGVHSRASDSISLVDEDGNSVAEVSCTVNSGMETLRLDVSNITGSYYIKFDNFNNGYDNWDMYELYLSSE